MTKPAAPANGTGRTKRVPRKKPDAQPSGARSPAAPANGAPPTPPGSAAGPTGPVPPQRPLVSARLRPRREIVRTVVLFVALAVIGAGLFAAAGAAYASAHPRAYRSEALVAVLPSETAATSRTVTTTTTTTITATTPVAVAVSADYTGIWVQLANSDPIRQAVARQLGVSESEVSSAVTVAAGSTSAAIVSITAESPDAARSARYANAMADQLNARNSAAPVPGYSVLVVSRATPPTAPSGMSSFLVVGGAALVGTVAGLALALWLHRRLRRRASAR